jgi:hypothetical protein
MFVGKSNRRHLSGRGDNEYIGAVNISDHYFSGSQK